MSKLYDALQEYTPLGASHIQSLIASNEQAQLSAFNRLGYKCDQVEASLSNLEANFSKFEAHLQLLRGRIQSQKIQAIKEKQSNFIINSLEQKIRKLTQEEQLSQREVQDIKRKCIQLEMSLQDEKSANQGLSLQVERLREEVRELRKENKRIKAQSKQTAQLPTFGQKQIIYINQSLNCNGESRDGLSNQQYQILEGKIKEIQEQFANQMDSEKSKCKKLEETIKSLNLECLEAANHKKKAYELQIRLNNVINENKDLQSSLEAALAKNSELEISLYKKSAEIKAVMGNEKKKSQKLLADIDQQLKRLVGELFPESSRLTMFIGSKSLQSKFGELGKEIQKMNKRNCQKVQMEKDLQIQRITLKFQKKQKDLQLAEGQLERLQQEITQKNEKNSSSVNGSLNANKSQTRSNNSNKQQEHKKEAREEKEKSLHQKIEAQEQTIEGLRKKYDAFETEMRQNCLKLETEITRKDMEIKLLKEKQLLREKQFKRASEEQANTKQELQAQFKSKLKQVEESRDALKQRAKESEHVGLQKLKRAEAAEKQVKALEDKLKKTEKKASQKQEEYQKIIQLKQKSINDLIAKNQTSNSSIKLLEQKIAILSMANDGEKDSEAKLVELKAKQKQTTWEKERLAGQVKSWQQKNKQLEQKLSRREKKLESCQTQISQLKKTGHEQQLQIKMLQSENEKRKKSIDRLQTNTQKQQHPQLKQQHEKKMKALKSRCEEAEKAKQEAVMKTNQLQSKLEAAQKNLSSLIERNQASLNQMNLKMFKQQQKYLKQIKMLQEKVDIAEQSSKINEKQNPMLMSVFPGRKNNKQIFKGTDSFELVSQATMTQNPEGTSIGVNTIDLFEAELRKEAEAFLPDQILEQDTLGFKGKEGDSLPEILIQAQEEIEVAEKQKNEEQIRSSNLFQNLNKNKSEVEDAFQICEEDEEVNFGQSSANLQIRQVFMSLRREIEKLFSEEEVSMNVVQYLPNALQDDYFQLVTFVKEKIATIHMQNQISFIMAEPGNAASEQESLELPELMERGGSEGNLRMLIQEKEALINSLMNERVSQENTINQLTAEKEEIEEENENKFMLQCNIYKKEIKEHKKQIDQYEMNFMSLVNITKNVLEIYSDPGDQEEDFRDNMTLLAQLAKLSEKERSRINFYIHKYMEMKGLEE